MWSYIKKELSKDEPVLKSLKVWRNIIGFSFVAILVGMLTMCSGDKKKIETVIPSKPNAKVEKSHQPVKPNIETQVQVHTLEPTTVAASTEETKEIVEETFGDHFPKRFSGKGLDEMILDSLPEITIGLDSRTIREILDIYRIQRLIPPSIRITFQGDFYKKIKSEQNRDLSTDLTYGLNLLYEGLLGDERYVENMGMDVDANRTLRDFVDLIITGTTDEEAEEDDKVIPKKPSSSQTVEEVMDKITKMMKERKEKESRLTLVTDHDVYTVYKDNISQQPNKEFQEYQAYLLSKVGFEEPLKFPELDDKIRGLYLIEEVLGVAREVIYFYPTGPGFPKDFNYLYATCKKGLDCFIEHKRNFGETTEVTEIRAEHLNKNSEYYSLFEDVGLEDLYSYIFHPTHITTLDIEYQRFLYIKKDRNIDELVRNYDPKKDEEKDQP